MIDTTDGELLAYIEDADNACLRQYAQLDPAGQRIYCVVDPAMTKADEPEPMQITVYDVANGEKAQELALPEVLLGGSKIEMSDQPVEELVEPAVVLSPDG